VSGDSLPRILVGVGQQPMADLQHHLDAHGPLPELRRRTPESLVALVEQTGLRGRGGAAFPVARKLAAVAVRRQPKIVLANGAEGEPASKTDRALLREVPHLVLDGIAVAAIAVGADEAIVAVGETDTRGVRGIEEALRQRQHTGLSVDPRIAVRRVPEGFVSGQETALINWANTGLAVPTFVGPRPFERGVQRLPTLVQNVETLAHIGLIARHGADWFKELGTPSDPGSALLTVSGHVASPGVYEIEQGMSLPQLLETVGAEPRPTGVLIGGYFGSWVPPDEIPNLRLDPGDLGRHGASLGAGVLAVLGDEACPVAETWRVANYLAGESAGQCGPCARGLPAIADAVQRLATGTATGGDHADLQRWLTELPGRGACQHPDGAVRFIRSALRVFAQDFADHSRNGRCPRCRQPGVLPVGPARSRELLAA
jgi:NADH:ubiquinone oxidoreductase subunit F (NADH-binding)